MRAGRCIAKRLGWILPMLLITTGCTSIRPQSVNSDSGRALINDRADRQAATLTFRNGRSVDVQDLQITDDSLFWMRKEGGAGRAGSDRISGRAAITDVSTVSFYTRRHAVRNAALGFVTGAAVGFLAGNSAEPSFAFSRESAAILGALGTGLLAAGIGALIGIDQTNRDVYTVEPPDE